MVEELDIADLRIHFLADYLIKSLRLRSDKWTKMVQIEEQNHLILEFCEKPQPTLLVFHVNPAGSLVSELFFNHRNSSLSSSSRLSLLHFHHH